MKLLNKNGEWMYQEKSWTITAEGSEGNIEDQLSGQVLGLVNDVTDIGTLVVLESKKRSVCSEGQKWLRDVEDMNGWFRLRNPLSGKVLTAQTSTITALAGMMIIFYVIVCTLLILFNGTQTSIDQPNIWHHIFFSGILYLHEQTMFCTSFV